MLTHIHGYDIYLPRIVCDHACSTLLQIDLQRGRGAGLRVAWHTDMVSRFESADMFAITFTKTKTQSGCHALVTSGIYVVMFDVIYCRADGIAEVMFDVYLGMSNGEMKHAASLYIHS
jgi:hypothetical protein